MQYEVSVDRYKVSKGCKAKDHEQTALSHDTYEVDRRMEDQYMFDALIDHEEPEQGQKDVHV